MKILLLGKNGQVGWELQRSLGVLGDLVALDRSGDGPLCGDLSDLDGLSATVRAVRPNVIVNAAAYTAVDKAEGEPELAQLINATAPGVLANEAAFVGAWLVHYSTDYVFDGSGTRPWQQGDPTRPLSVYGRSKLAGETAVREAGCRHLIFRTSWVYASRGNNFAKTMLRLATEREALSVVADQWGAPTGAELVADVTAHSIRQAVARPELSGTYHLAAAGEASWWEYADFVIEKARTLGATLALQPGALHPIASVDYPTPARRPLNSRLDTSNLRGAFDLTLPEWREGVGRIVMETLE
jgi:dTDP-4-dehydrorhamnose reductase